MSLKKSAISGVKWTSLSTVVLAFLQVLQIAILARFLSASDFGIMAIVMVVIGFAQSFLDMGISNAIIYKQKVSHRQLSTLYWVNVLAGTALYVVVYFASPLVASFYHEERLEGIIKMVGVIFLIAPYGQQFFVLLEKELAFRRLAKISIIGKVVALFTASYLAYSGFGVYALVYSAIVSTFSTTLLYVMMGRGKHKPAFIFELKEVRDFLQFGLFQMGERMVNYFNSQFDTILIGKLLGVENLGIYTIAKEIVMKPAAIINPVLTRVAFPTMSKIQNDISRLKVIYLKMINYIASVNFPIYVVIIVLAPDLIGILFGNGWERAVPIVQILGIFGAIRSIINPTGSLLLARGRADLGFWWNFGLLLYTPLSIYIYSFWGLEGVAWGLVANMILLQLPAYYILIKPLCGAGVKEYFWQIVKPLILTLLATSFFIVLSKIFVSQFFILIISGLFLILLYKLYNKSFFDMALGLVVKGDTK